jgi:hypothetical protein
MRRRQARPTGRPEKRGKGHTSSELGRRGYSVPLSIAKLMRGRTIQLRIASAPKDADLTNACELGAFRTNSYWIPIEPNRSDSLGDSVV